ncbi:hypothetical protein [Goodfellowiella coeruleoviolacea]|uniref:Uncharacterized protein n=1 Tax=Goodfellowiella coeruleoviolacea TaxID=334858 RepID=A0AAE3KJG2_9PSEU|nr:hypothetical protein [Goodfellowiella coeruleoviolacea]MCP2169595.1 hypothetical protein [Goodfellowiella coeruleoviolacea]
MSYPGGQQPQFGQPTPWHQGPPPHHGQPAPLGGHPAPPAYPQQGYPQQGYPQTGYPQHPGPVPPAHGATPPGVPSGPLTLPGPGALPTLLGIALMVVAMFALPWADDVHFLDIYRATTTDALKQAPLSVQLAGAYVTLLGFVAYVVPLLSTLPWTLGAIRTQRAARWLAGVRRKPLSHSSFTWFRLVYTGRALIPVVIHVTGVVLLFQDSTSAMGPGPWVMIIGALLALAGAWTGPRKGPAMPY